MNLFKIGNTIINMTNVTEVRFDADANEVFISYIAAWSDDPNAPNCTFSGKRLYGDEALAFWKHFSKTATKIGQP